MGKNSLEENETERKEQHKQQQEKQWKETAIDRQTHRDWDMHERGQTEQVSVVLCCIDGDDV